MALSRWVQNTQNGSFAREEGTNHNVTDGEMEVRAQMGPKVFVGDVPSCPPPILPCPHTESCPYVRLPLCFRLLMSQEQASRGEGRGCAWHDDMEAVAIAAKGSKTGKAPPKFKFATPPRVEKFKATNYMKKEVKYIGYESLRRDENQQYGQIRPLVNSHLQKMVAEFRDNEPYEIALTVWLHGGAPPFPPPRALSASLSGSRFLVD